MIAALDVNQGCCGAGQADHVTVVLSHHQHRVRIPHLRAAGQSERRKRQTFAFELHKSRQWGVNAQGRFHDSNYVLFRCEADQAAFYYFINYISKRYILQVSVQQTSRNSEVK